MKSRSNFHDQQAHVKRQYHEYADQYKVLPLPTAYMEKYDKREPESLIKKRYQMYHDLKKCMEYGLTKCDMTMEEAVEQMQDPSVPNRYIRRAKKELGKELGIEHEFGSLEKNEEKEDKKPLHIKDLQKTIQEEKNRLELEGIDLGKLAAEELLKQDKIRSMIEQYMKEGYEKIELVDMSEKAGIDHAIAEDLVEDIVTDDEELHFSRDERKEMEEYIEEELEMVH